MPAVPEPPSLAEVINIKKYGWLSGLEESITMPIITVDITKTVSTDLQAEKIFNPVHIQVILYQQGFYPDLTSYYKYKILDTLLKTYKLYKFLFV